jgi:hypothetical protein
LCCVRPAAISPEDRQEQLLGAEALAAVTRAGQPAHQAAGRTAIAVRGAITLVTDHERHCGRNSIKTGYSVLLTSCQLGIDLQRVVGDPA